MSTGGRCCRDRRTGWLRVVSPRDCLMTLGVAIGGSFLDVVVTAVSGAIPERRAARCGDESSSACA